jgi:hypothetical protein
MARLLGGSWLFRYVITASIHGHFLVVLRESSSYSRGYKHTHPVLERNGVPASVALRQHLQQGFGFLEISGIKALGEPAVDRGQQLVRFGPLALLPPQAC